MVPCDTAAARLSHSTPMSRFCLTQPEVTSREGAEQSSENQVLEMGELWVN